MRVSCVVSCCSLWESNYGFACKPEHNKLYNIIRFPERLIQWLVHDRIWVVTSARKSFHENNTSAVHHSYSDWCFASWSVGISPTAVHPYFYLFGGFIEDEILSRHRGVKLGGLAFEMDKGLSDIFR